MKQGMLWYHRYPRDFIDGVQGMKPELIGAYSIIIDLLYARGGEMPRDDRHLSGVLGCTPRMAKSLTNQLLERGKLIEEGGILTNSRVEREVEAQRNSRESAANRKRKQRKRERRSSKTNDLEDHVARDVTGENRKDKKSPLTPETRAERVEQWLEAHLTIPHWMDAQEYSDAMRERGWSDDQLSKAGFTIRHRGGPLKGDK